MRRQIVHIDDKVEYVEHMKDLLNPDANVNDFIEEKIVEFEPLISDAKTEMMESNRLFQGWAFLSILIPLFFLFRIGFGYPEFPNPWAVILIFYSLGIGPIIMLLSKRHFEQEINPIIHKVDILRRCALTNRIIKVGE